MNGFRIPQDRRYLVYCYGILAGGEAEWDFAYQQSKVTNVAAEERRLHEALTCTQVPWLLSRSVIHSTQVPWLHSKSVIYCTQVPWFHSKSVIYCAPVPWPHSKSVIH